MVTSEFQNSLVLGSNQSERYPKTDFITILHIENVHNFLAVLAKLLSPKIHLGFQRQLAKAKRTFKMIFLTSCAHYPFLRIACLASSFGTWLKWIGFRIGHVCLTSGLGCAWGAFLTFPSVPLWNQHPGGHVPADFENTTLALGEL